MPGSPDYLALILRQSRFAHESTLGVEGFLTETCIWRRCLKSYVLQEAVRRRVEILRLRISFAKRSRYLAQGDNGFEIRNRRPETALTVPGLTCQSLLSLPRLANTPEENTSPRSTAVTNLNNADSRAVRSGQARSPRPSGPNR